MKKHIEGEKHSIAELMEIIEELRDPKTGCAWDAEQTLQSYKKCLYDEAGEVFEAVDKDDADNLCEELGDVLMILLSFAQLSKEKGRFDFNDVIDGVTDKLIRRHPHVFGDYKRPETAEESLELWKMVKKQEKERKEKKNQEKKK
ncbi:MAG: nucleotide pyrophosphohydrolase [Lachnospiraceae bacterium]|nr:nucleotide pyrophosphohydrolase [Lachnospiraceae bacterium]